MSDFQLKNQSSYTFKSCNTCNATNYSASGLNETLPAIVMKDNRFEKNMAYFAGNAFYIRNTMRTMELFDYLQFCGAATLIESNIFEGNIGMKRHNGGAGVIRCKRISDTNGEDFPVKNFINRKQTSGLFLKERNATDDELKFWNLESDEQADLEYAYFEDAIDTVLNVTDIFDFDDDGLYRTNYTLERYSTYITNNTFRNNYSGKKGTALLISEISELSIYDNLFEENGPVTAVKEMQYSPYYEFLANRNRTITYFTGNETCMEEMAYYDRC